MDTTISLEPEVYQIAQALAAERHQSVVQVVKDAILCQRESLLPAVGEVVIDPYGWPVFRSGKTVTSEEVKAFLEED